MFVVVLFADPEIMNCTIAPQQVIQHLYKTEYHVAIKYFEFLIQEMFTQ